MIRKKTKSICELQITNFNPEEGLIHFSREGRGGGGGRVASFFNGESFIFNWWDSAPLGASV